MKEHEKVELQERQIYTISTRRQSQSEQDKFEITDHVNTENHVINWDEATIIAVSRDVTKPRKICICRMRIS